MTALLVRASPVLVFLILLAMRWSTLDQPPFWDATWTTAVGATELARSGLDFASLIQSPDLVDGGPGTHSTSFYTILSGILQWAVGPIPWLRLSHVVSICMGAALFHATYLLGRRWLSTPVALLGGLAVTTLPMTLQQVSDIYIDLPVAVFVTYTLWAVMDRHPVLATVFAFLAIGMKPTGLVVIPVLPFSLPPEQRRSGRALATMSIASLPLVPFLVRHFALGRAPRLADPLFLTKSALFGLGLTPDVAAIVLLGSVAVWKIRSEDRVFAWVGGLVLAGFLILGAASILAQRATVLPRYHLVVIPVAFVALMIDLQRRHPTSGPALLAAGLLAVSLLNSHGDFYPLRDHPHPVYAERSLRASDYLQLELATTQALAAEEVGLIMVDDNIRVRLLYPELGFVDRAATGLVRIDDIGIERLATEESMVWAVEPHGVRANADLTLLARDAGLVVDRNTVHDGTWQAWIVKAREP